MLRLEGGDAIVDALVIDLRDGGGVSQLGWTGFQHFGLFLSVLSSGSESVLIHGRDAESSKGTEMSTLHSLLDNLAAAGTVYGWRIDAIVLGGLIWALASGYAQVRTSIG